MSNISAKLHTIRSKIISLSGKSYPYYFIIAALIAAFYNHYFIILVIFLIYKFKRKFHYKPLLIIITILIISFLSNYFIKSIKPKEEVKGTVIEVNDYNLVVKSDVRKYLIKTKDSYEVGEILIIKGKFIKPRGKRVPHGFNYKNYLVSEDIYYIFDKPEIKSKGINFLYYPYIFLNKYLDIYPKHTKTYLKSFILGINEHNLDFKYASRNLQISYLLSLSGIFIYGLLGIIKKIFFYLDLETNKQDIIIILILLLWTIISGFKYVMLRILIITLISTISRRLDLKLTRLDILFYAFILLLIVKPNLVYSIGFTISFIVLTLISLINFDLKISNKILKGYVLYLLIYVSIFPLIINMYNNIYLLVFLISPVIILIYKKGIIYLFIGILLMPFFSLLIEYYLIYFESLIRLLSNLKLNIIMPSFNKLSLFLYYLILIFYLTNKRWLNKNIITYFMLLFLVFNKAYLNPTYRLIFLDVDQGDTTIFITPFNEDVVVVDAYGDVVKVLHKMGVRKIDYLILTHSDNDHIREANNLIRDLDVKNVLVNPYDEYNLVSCNEISITSNNIILESNFSIKFYSPNKNYYNSNDNSLAFKLEYLNNSALFLGDVSKEVEINLVKEYGSKLESKILKLAHHGSNTSTSTNLLDTVKPKDIIISVGLNNIYGFPHNEVMEALDRKYKVYRTDKDHTITYISLDKWTKTLKHYQNYIIYYIILEKKKGRFYG